MSTLKTFLMVWMLILPGGTRQHWTQAPNIIATWSDFWSTRGAQWSILLHQHVKCMAYYLYNHHKMKHPKNISLLWKTQLLGMCGETEAPPTSRNSSPRFLWLEPILSSRSCWWAPIFRCLSPTLLYRPWCLLPGWSTRYRVNEGNGRRGGNQANWGILQ